MWELRETVEVMAQHDRGRFTSIIMADKPFRISVGRRKGTPSEPAGPRGRGEGGSAELRSDAPSLGPGNCLGDEEVGEIDFPAHILELLRARSG